MSTRLWNRNDIQFPRLIAELEAAGAFTRSVMTDLRESMDLTDSDISELIDRAQYEWERVKAETL